MTGEEVLALAASHGVRVTFALGDLHLEADHEPPAEALVALRDHKEAVVAELARIAATAGEWCWIFEDHVRTIMRVRRLPAQMPSAPATKTFSSSFSTAIVQTRCLIAAPGAAVPRRQALSCCRSGRARMYGCTAIVGNNGATTVGRK